jgi:hypothetical protein
MPQRLEAQSESPQANALNRDLAEISLQDTREALYHELPTFIYNDEFNTDQLHRTNLVTGKHSTRKVPSYTFKYGCCWSEVPGASLLITGGGYPGVRDVVRTLVESLQFLDISWQLLTNCLRQLR